MRSSRLHGTGMASAARHLARLACVFLAGAALSACGDEQASRGERRAADPDGAGAHTVAWLETSNTISPAQWLMSRGERHARPITDPDVQNVTAQLAIAHKRYRESERMIANRSVQISDMLDGIGIREHASDILADLTSISAEVGQTEGYGSICQHYFNLRAASVSRADALATLKARYGAKS